MGRKIVGCGFNSHLPYRAQLVSCCSWQVAKVALIICLIPRWGQGKQKRHPGPVTITDDVVMQQRLPAQLQSANLPWYVWSWCIEAEPPLGRARAAALGPLVPGTASPPPVIHTRRGACGLIWLNPEEYGRSRIGPAAGGQLGIPCVVIGSFKLTCPFYILQCFYD